MPVALIDAFTDNSFNAALFTKTETTATVTEQNNRLEFIYTTGYPGTGFVTSVATYDLTGSETYFKLELLPTSATYLRFDVMDASGDGWGIRLNRGSGLIQPQTLSGGVPSTFTQPTYTHGTDVWFRLREASGTVYWDTSTDGASWSARANTAKPGNVDLTAMNIKLGMVDSDATGTIAVSNVYGPSAGGSSIAAISSGYSQRGLR